MTEVICSDLEVVGYFFQHEETGNVMSVDAQQVDWGFEANNPRLHRVCALADYDKAQAIIDGLRGELEAAGEILAQQGRRNTELRKMRDQHAQRIGELEAALEFACKSLAQVTSSDGSGHADIAVSVLRMAGTKDADALHVVEAYKAGAKWRIDAALSAGKEGE